MKLNTAFCIYNASELASNITVIYWKFCTTNRLQRDWIVQRKFANYCTLRR